MNISLNSIPIPPFVGQNRESPPLEYIYIFFFEQRMCCSTCLNSLFVELKPHRYK